MKATKILLLSATTAVTLAASQNLMAADGSSQLAAIKQNAALVHSPRMIELYPELARFSVASTTDSSKPDTKATQLAEIVKNPAFANSPRVREQYPELAFYGQTPSASSSKSDASTTELARVMQNQALASSPRMKEQFPELKGRNTGFEKSIEIAPLK
ncbi:MAG TPA: hypothetical protein VIK53_15965 [Verrucomicrobiae bacterium]